MKIHSTAIVHPDAKIDEDVSIGPFSIVEAGAKIAEGCSIAGHVQILGRVKIGANCKIDGGTILGGFPQDLKFDPNTNSGVEIGAENQFRENVTIHRGASEDSWTRVGEQNYLMVGSHLGHDVQIGDHNILANNVLLGGHVKMGSRNFLGGGSAYHQFIHIGDHCMVKGNSSVSQDVPSYVMCALVNEVHGLNVVGLRRAGFDVDARTDLKKAYELIYRCGLNVSQALERAQSLQWSELASKFIDCFEQGSGKGVCHPPKKVARA